MTTDGTWLDDDQQRAWRGWLALSARLPGALARDLQQHSDLSLPDFDVLVQLSESAQGRVRFSGLATALAWQRSRLSHHVARMAGRGLVQRVECDDDGRGAFVEITTAGRSAIETAAPGHVATVRRLVFDALDPEQVRLLEELTGTLLQRLDAEST